MFQTREVSSDHSTNSVSTLDIDPLEKPLKRLSVDQGIAVGSFEDPSMGRERSVIGKSMKRKQGRQVAGHVLDDFSKRSEGGERPCFRTDRE